MNVRHPTTAADRLALGFAGGCLGLILGGLLSFVFQNWAIVWYTTAYFALVCIVLGPIAADIVAMVLAAMALLFVTTFGGIAPEGSYEENPFDKPRHWALLALFFPGFVGVLFYAKGA
jgi:hypothetical protein